MSRVFVFILIGLATLLTAGCAAATPTALPPTSAPTGAPPGAVTELVVVTHDSFAVSEEVLAEFEAGNHARVQILKSGDAGSALNKAILAGAANPLGDVFFGVDNTFLSRAAASNLFESYRPAGLDAVPAGLQRDPEARLTPIDYGYVCLNYDKQWFKNKNLAPPQTLDDLVKPDYKSLLVVENPATSSPGLAFLMTTVGQYGPKYLDFWRALRANDVAISEGWEDAYYNKSTWSGNGDRPIVVSYATSPAAEVYFSEGKLTEPPTGNVLGDGSCFLQVEFAGVFKNARQPALARAFLDFMLSPRFQEDIPLQMFVYPANPAAKLPDFYKFAETPTLPVRLDEAEIDANRETWLKEWTQTMLR
jgi:thiamine transport system substrate-binding protein